MSGNFVHGFTLELLGWRWFVEFAENIDFDPFGLVSEPRQAAETKNRKHEGKYRAFDDDDHDRKCPSEYVYFLTIDHP